MTLLTAKKLLVSYEVPLLLRATDSVGSVYLCLNVDDFGDVYRFLVVNVTNQRYEEFLDEKYDLRYMMSNGRKGSYLIGSFDGGEGTRFSARKFSRNVENWLPEKGFFLRDGREVDDIYASYGRQKRTVYIDGRWGLDDWKQFSKLMQDSYAFVYAVSFSDDRKAEKVTELFVKHPWRGGFSAVNFFDDLYSLIPRGDNARVSKVAYASPGEIVFELNAEISDRIRMIVDEMIVSKKLADRYDEVHGFLKEKKWLGRSSGELQLGDNENRDLMEIFEAFSGDIGINQFSDNVLRIALGDPLSAVKILLSFYRKLHALKDYVLTGKITEFLV